MTDGHQKLPLVRYKTHTAKLQTPKHQNLHNSDPEAMYLMEHPNLPTTSAVINYSSLIHNKKYRRRMSENPSKTELKSFREILLKKTKIINLIQSITEYEDHKRLLKDNSLRRVLRACQPLIKIAESYKRGTPNIAQAGDITKSRYLDSEPRIREIGSRVSAMADLSKKEIEDYEIKEIAEFHHFLEEFMVVGVESGDLEEWDGDYVGQVGEFVVSPQLLFSSRNLIEGKAGTDFGCISGFLFPFGFTVERLGAEELEGLIEK